MERKTEEETGRPRRYALFTGCYISTRVPSMEKSARTILNRLGIELVEMRNASCCPDPIVMKGVDQKTWLAMAARNLCLAEEMGLDILTLCNGCFETLKTANVTLREDSKLRNETNQILSKIGREFKGVIEVEHLVNVLTNQKEACKALVRNPLKDMSIAVHYGCHLLRPSRVLKTDDPFHPTLLDELVEEVIGAKSLQYRRKMWCCGAPAMHADQELSLKILREKLRRIGSAGADCIALICPFCQIQFDMGQLLIKRKLREDYSIPVLGIPQLLGLAMDISPAELGLDVHILGAGSLLQKIGCEA